MINSFTLLFALTTVITVCEGTVDISGIVIRQANTSTAGGFATRADTCSTGQFDCAGAITQEVCCPPTASFCYTDKIGVCCPTRESPHLLFFGLLRNLASHCSDVDCTKQVFAAPQVSI